MTAPSVIPSEAEARRCEAWASLRDPSTPLRSAQDDVNQ